MPWWRKSVKERLSQQPNVSVDLPGPERPQSEEPNPSTEYCAICTSLDFQELFSSTEEKRLDLPNRLLTHIRASRSCPFCRLTLLAVEDHPAVRNQNEGLGVMGYSQTGKDSAQTTFTNKRTIYLWVFQDTAGTFMILPSQPHMFGIRALGTNPREFLPKQGNYFFWEPHNPDKSDLLCGRIVEPKYFNPELPRWWLRQCKQKHGTPCSATPSSSNFGLKVIDVELGCIVNAPANCEYAALSYVWGNVKQLLLRKDTRTRLLSPGGILNGDRTNKRASGPQPTLTIRDAILLCRHLGLRYLWVDALCIQQDSEDRMIQIKNMVSHLGAMGCIKFDSNMF